MSKVKTVKAGTVVAEVAPAAPTKKGVVGWQKNLKLLRSLVNDLQNHIEDGIADKMIVERLQLLAKAERVKVEKSETIPARLNRRFEKYTKFAPKATKA